MARARMASRKWYFCLLFVMFLVFSTPTPFVESSASESSSVALRGMEFHTHTMSREPASGALKGTLAALSLLLLSFAAALPAPRASNPLRPIRDEHRFAFHRIRKQMLQPLKYTSTYVS